jgi:hypothetical protein
MKISMQGGKERIVGRVSHDLKNYGDHLTRFVASTSIVVRPILLLYMNFLGVLLEYLLLRPP